MTLEELRSKLHYDPDTGIFTWINARNNTGKQAGWDSKHGYWRIGFARKQNRQNIGRKSTSKSGFKGVVVDESRNKKYKARIHFTENGNRKVKSLGNFYTPEEASAAYHAAAEEMHGSFYAERARPLSKEALEAGKK